jgi:transposase-like protein
MNMVLKQTKQQEKEILKEKAISLYKQGFTTREIGRTIGKSHSWVALIVKGKEIK